MRKKVLAFSVIALVVAALITVGAFAKERETNKRLDTLRNDCSDVTDLPCITHAITSVVLSDGLDAGFRVIRALYLQQPSFRPVCHPLALRVGEALADALPMYETFSYTPESTVCNYGFFQSYPTTLLKNGVSIEHAQTFCDMSTRMIALFIPDARAECYRGIGRGLPFFNKELYGDSEKMAHFGIQTCKEIAPGKKEYDDCISGVFNNLGRETANGNYGLSIRKTDPLWLCREQASDDIALRCYGNFKNVSLDLVLNNPTPQDIFKQVESVYGSSPIGTEELLYSAGYEMARKSLGDTTAAAQETSSTFCENIPAPFDVYCAQGFAVGLAKHGTPWKQHLQVMDFCKRASTAIPSLTPSLCVRDALFYLRGFYSPAQDARMCQDIKDKLGVSCQS